MDIQYKSKRALVGIDGNAFSVIGTVARGLREAGAPPEYVSEFQSKAMSSESYDALLALAIDYTEDAYGEEEDE